MVYLTLSEINCLRGFCSLASTSNVLVKVDQKLVDFLLCQLGASVGRKCSPVRKVNAMVTFPF